MTLIKLMALFCSINFLLFQLNIRNDYSKQQKGTSSLAGMYFFYVIKDRYLSLKGGRSPPVNRICTKKNSIDWRNEYMGNHPKRRKDKYNPYSIYETDGKHYISFRDGQGVLQQLEICKELYDTFDEFELKDISYLHKWDKYIEHSQLWESTLNERAFLKPDTVEDIVMKNIETESLHKAISKLPETQKRRLLLYFFDGLTYEQIAKMEGCTKMPVKRSIDVALQKLKKEIKKT